MTSEFTVQKRSLGVTFSTDGQAHVLVWAPLAKHVAIKLQETQEAIPLKKEEYGYWQLTTHRIRPGDLYTVVLDGKMECADPVSLAQPQGIEGPSQAVDTNAFYWEDASWVNPALADYLIYELHIGTFTDEGTFRAVETKLDYLKALGVNAIQLMPVAQFSDSRNWGYDGVFTFAAQNTYGGAAGLQHLINACHVKGLAVVLDVVYNHFGPEGNTLGEFGPYLTDKYKTPWGEAVNVDDAWCDGVRRYIIDNALTWLRDFHVDALRLDAVHAIKDFSPVHILQELRQEVDHLMESTGRRHYLLVECDLNDPRYIDPLTEHGYGMDAQWMDEFHHSLRVTVGEEQTGYYADFNSINCLEKAYRDGYVYDGQFSAVRQKFFGRSAGDRPGHQFIVFSQNHDQVGNRKQGERSSQLFGYDTLKLLAGAVLFSPYVPLLFMGEEWGEPSPFLYFASHLDPALSETVRQGREEEFGASKSDDNVPDPATEETYDQTKLQWDLLTQEPHKTLLHYYKTGIALRQQLPALNVLDRQHMHVAACDSRQTITLHRWHNDQHVVCLMNFSKEPQPVELGVSGPAGQWTKLLDSAGEQWHPQTGVSSAPDLLSGTETITLQPESLVLYAQGHEHYQLNLPTIPV